MELGTLSDLPPEPGRKTLVFGAQPVATLSSGDFFKSRSSRVKGN
jgi:hypothetical protein